MRREEDELAGDEGIAARFAGPSGACKAFPEMDDLTTHIVRGRSRGHDRRVGGIIISFAVGHHQVDELRVDMHDSSHC